MNSLMQKMVRSIYEGVRCSLSLLFSLLFFCTCTQDEIGSILPDVVEGEKTTLLLRFKSNDPIEVRSRASLTQSREREINSLALFIFDEEGRMVSSSFHASVQTHVCDLNGTPLDVPLDPDGTNYFPIETLSGNNRKIYVIANYDANIIQGLKAVATEEQFKELVFEVVSNPLAREFGISKVGTIASAQVRKGIPIEVSLQYVSAKISLNVINKNANFELEGWTLDNIPTKSYVVERTPNFANDPNYHDAMNMNDHEDYFHDFSDQRFLFETTPGTVVGTYSTVFYMTENRRGGRIKRDDPPVGWPNGTILDGLREDYQLKAWFAPSGATCVKIYGTLKSASGNKQLIVINHFLGGNSVNDYNIQRATHYTYNVTISSLGKIKIDTNVEISTPQLRVDPPADLKNLDGHYGFRLFRVHTQEILDPAYTVSAEVLQAVNSNVPAPWLNLAITPVTMHHLKSSDSEIAKWQQDGGAIGSFVRPKFIPNKATRSALQAAGRSYVPPNGITLGSAEYPDDDTSLPFSMAIRRMCKKITNLPTKGTFPALSDMMNIMLYTDEYAFDNSPTAPAYREAVVRFTIAKDGVDLEHVHFTIRQYPPHRFVQLPGQITAMLVERVEEYEQMLMPTMPLNFQMLAGLQWGPYILPTTAQIDDGALLTLQGVYSNVNSTRSANNYLPKYGGEAGGWSFANNGLISEPGNVAHTSYYNLPAVTDPNHLNAIYNITAARYCHEKNWDENGNGNIDEEETFWYLPSSVELQQFWTLHELLDMRPDYYWSSEQKDNDNAYAFSMLSSPSDPHLVYNGVAQGYRKSGTHSFNRPRVRCLRRAALGVSPLAPLVLHRSDNTSVVDCSVLPGSVHSTQTKMGIAQGDPGSLHRANEKIFKRFEVSRSQPAPADYYSLHFGNGLCDQSKGWRLPTQREMLLIWAVKERLQSNLAFAKFVVDDANDLLNHYWTMSRDLQSRYTVDFKTGLCRYESFQGNNIKHNYRCIREVQ